MIDTDKLSDLRRLYDLFMLVPGHEGRDAFRMALRMDIEERGKAVNQGALEPEAGPSGVATPLERDQALEDDLKGKGKARAAAPSSAASALSSALRWVQDTLDLKDKFDQLLEQAFNGDISVQTSINEVSSPPHSRDIGAHPFLGVSIIYQRESQSSGISLSVHRRTSQEGYQSRASSVASQSSPLTSVEI